MSLIHNETLLVDEIAVRVRRAGETGPGLLFLHGWADSGVVWERALRHWGEDYRAVALDQPGHGGSARLPGQVGVKALAAHLVAASHAAGLERATVVGHSFGGLLALQMALDAPELVERLVLVNPIWAGELPWYVQPGLWAPVGRPMLAALHPARQLAARLLDRAVGWMSEGQRAQYARWRAFTEAEPGWLYEAMVLTTTDLRREVWRIGQPALVIVGSQDRTVPPVWTWRLAKELAEGEALIMRAGHHPMEDDWEGFVRAVGGWLRGQ